MVQILVRRILRMVDLEVLDSRVDRAGNNDVAGKERRRIASSEHFDTETSKRRISAGEEATGTICFFESTLSAICDDAVTRGRCEVVELTARPAGGINAVTAEKQFGIAPHRDHARTTASGGDRVATNPEAAKCGDSRSAIAVAGRATKSVDRITARTAFGGRASSAALRGQPNASHRL